MWHILWAPLVVVGSVLAVGVVHGSTAGEFAAMYMVQTTPILALYVVLAAIVNLPFAAACWLVLRWWSRRSRLISIALLGAVVWALTTTISWPDTGQAAVSVDMLAVGALAGVGYGLGLALLLPGPRR